MYDIGVADILPKQCQEFRRKAIRSTPFACGANFGTAAELALHRGAANMGNCANRDCMPLARHFTRHLQATCHRTTMGWIHARNYLHYSQRRAVCSLLDKLSPLEI